MKRTKKPKPPKLYGMRKYWPHLTEELAEKEREKLSVKQDGKCGICKKDEKEFHNRLSVDHNHRSKQVRGLLCYRCNKFTVGRHTYDTALKLLNYLKVEVEG